MTEADARKAVGTCRLGRVWLDRTPTKADLQDLPLAFIAVIDDAGRATMTMAKHADCLDIRFRCDCCDGGLHGRPDPPRFELGADAPGYGFVELLP